VIAKASSSFFFYYFVRPLFPAARPGKSRHFVLSMCQHALLNYTPRVLHAGNKIDRDDREIPSEVGDEFAQRHGMYFLETSAKACDNVERLFNEIAAELLQVGGVRVLSIYE